MFRRKKFTEISPKEKVEIKKEMWIKCDNCGKMVYKKTWEEKQKICPSCGKYSRLTAYERIRTIADENTFKELWKDLVSGDPLNFVGIKPYKEKLKEDMEKTRLNEGLVVGECKIESIPSVLSVLDPHFIMGSMGAVVGEKFTKGCEYAIASGFPFICISGGGGGARMYEGIISLMQMAKTSSAVGRLKEKGILYISVLTDPTMGGVAASFAFLGDIIIAEPGALIGFAGPRVIEQTIKQKLPPGFQTSEFLYQHGMIDMIVKRDELKEIISKILKVFFT